MNLIEQVVVSELWVLREGALEWGVLKRAGWVLQSWFIGLSMWGTSELSTIPLLFFTVILAVTRLFTIEAQALLDTLFSCGSGSESASASI